MVALKSVSLEYAVCRAVDKNGESAAQVRIRVDLTHNLRYHASPSNHSDAGDGLGRLFVEEEVVH